MNIPPTPLTDGPGWMPNVGSKVLCRFCNRQHPVKDTLEIEDPDAPEAFFPVTICQGCYDAQRHHHNPPQVREYVRRLRPGRVR